MSSKSKRKKRELEIIRKLTNFKRLAREAARLEREGKDSSATFEALFNTMEWLVEHKASESVRDGLYLMEADEVDIIDFVINETVYRLDCINQDGKQVTITPFAIPMAILAPIEHKQRLESIKELPKTTEYVGKNKLIRKALDIGEEPTTILDRRLWRPDLAEWQSDTAIRNYLNGYVAFFSGYRPALPPFAHQQTEKPKVQATHQSTMDKSTVYFITRALIGAVISGNDDIDENIFGYRNMENIPDDVEVVDSPIMNELLVACETELTEMGINNAKVMPLSPYPVELWEVPKVTLNAHRRIELSSKADFAVSKLPGGMPRDGYLKIVFDNDADVHQVRLFAYEKGITKPFFSYTWDIVPALEEVDNITDIIIKIAIENLKVDEIIGPEPRPETIRICRACTRKQ